MDAEDTLKQHISRARVWYRCRTDPETTEDLVAEVALRLWRASQRGIEITEGYWWKTVRSVHNDHLRYHRYNQHLPLLSDPRGPECAEQIALSHLWYQECLAEFSERTQYIVRARVEGQCTFQDIAGRMRASPDSIRKLYQRAIARLRARHGLPARKWDKPALNSPSESARSLGVGR